ncbi:ATP-binding cassette domain-containing protein [Facklamia miroungae]|uniref:ABC-2 type transport system ATP-binding protein n=1 Tax=Facklamia miroungae TaxID=120956 RepID=A0A1G7RXN4_9LACT|nr:ABC transporter ATP-binding protein [Facklamia miroungae]SDG15528.1 ABC-2 type transport system ATP-binding protein [Facklamia miroungae]
MFIKKLRHEYPNFKLEIDDLMLNSNTIIGLIGENGAGKTTLMNILSGMNTANQNLQIDDHNLENILYIPSDVEPYEFMTVMEFITIVIKYSDSSISPQIIIDKLELNEKENTLISELSQGMKKKLTLINLFLNNYSLIILDEPFKSVDIKFIYQMKKIILGLKEDSIILISSHILDTLEDICDEFIYLEKGKIKKMFKNDQNHKSLESELFD